MESSSCMCAVYSSPVFTYGSVCRWAPYVSPWHQLATLHTCKRADVIQDWIMDSRHRQLSMNFLCISKNIFSVSRFSLSAITAALFSFWFHERKINLFLFFTLCSNARFSAFQHPSSPARLISSQLLTRHESDVAFSLVYKQTHH